MVKVQHVLAAVALGAASAAAASGQADPAQPAMVLHPEDVALVEEGAEGFVYRHFPTGLRLYTSDKDPLGRSLCYEGCASAWPPVVVTANAVAVGPWTIIDRSDGRRQWALQGKPIYVRYHDTPDVPTGDGVEGIWHLVPHTATKDARPLPEPRR